LLLIWPPFFDFHAVVVVGWRAAQKGPWRWPSRGGIRRARGSGNGRSAVRRGGFGAWGVADGSFGCGKEFLHGIFMDDFFVRSRAEALNRAKSDRLTVLVVLSGNVGAFALDAGKTRRSGGIDMI